MKRIAGLLFITPFLFAGVIPNRYIVELSTEPVAEHVTRTYAPRARRAAMRGDAARQHRVRVRTEQRDVRTRIEQASGEVLDSVDTASNSLIVRIPDADAAQLARIPGVKKVHPVRELHLMLDHALPLHRVPEAWSQVGMGNAGAGVKVAIIDTGLDVEHPGFDDPSLPMPDGFPKANIDSDLVYTSHKVIVARSYAQLFSRADPDTTPRDHVGHGTATAMIATGVRNSGPLATITGVAPKAWVGNYKVFGSPGVNDGAPEDAVLKAIDDAVADGMDVISMSLGSDVALRLQDDPEVISLERAASLGIIVVASAGNNGPDPGTVGSPSNAPSVIGVGASNNDRIFATSVVTSTGSRIFAIAGSGRNSASPITASVVDVSKLDGTGLACAALPANSLTGAIALILRGQCTFEAKLLNAQAAGATAGLVYAAESNPDPISMGVGSATLPAEMISYQSGTELKQQLGSSLQATMQFTLGPAYIDPARLANFSAAGPNVDFSIKPDLVAVGESIYMATQKLDSRGEMYDAGGYTIEGGTSFSAPLVAGAAAVLKAARPGLTSAQYRSLLVDTAAPASLVPGTPARVQRAGAGLLDLSAALNATAAVSPVSVSFGSGTSSPAFTRTLTISNVGTAADTFQFSVLSGTGGPVPLLSTSSVRLGPGASTDITVGFSGTALQPGGYEGVITVQGANSSVQTKVPYWYGVPSDIPRYITVTHTESTARAGASVTDAILFKVSDAAGIPVTGKDPVVTVISGGGSLTSVRSRDGIYPNTFGLRVRLGPRAGANTFRIQVGDATRDVTIVGN